MLSFLICCCCFVFVGVGERVADEIGDAVAHFSASSVVGEQEGLGLMLVVTFVPWYCM